MSRLTRFRMATDRTPLNMLAQPRGHWIRAVLRIASSRRDTSQYQRLCGDTSRCVTIQSPAYQSLILPCLRIDASCPLRDIIWGTGQIDSFSPNLTAVPSLIGSFASRAQAAERPAVDERILLGIWRARRSVQEMVSPAPTPQECGVLCTAR